VEITLDNHWPLLLFLAIPLLWWARKSTAIDLTRRHLLLSTLVRSALVAFVALALTQPVLRRLTADVSVIYALDVSHSVAPGAVADAIKWIGETNKAAKPEHARFVAFAANSMTFEKLEDLQNVNVANGPGTPGAIDRSGTDLAGALEGALRSFAPHHLKRIVVISDGNGNSGDLTSELSRLRLEKARVHTRPLAVRADRDVWIEAVKAPSTVTAEEQFPLEVMVYSQSNTTANVEIKNNAKSLGKRSVTLSPGVNRVAFETRVPEEKGSVVLQASVAPAEDTFSGNNAFREPVIVTPQPRVLYVEGHAASARYLGEALVIEGFRMDVIDPARIPTTSGALAGYDAVIISDVDGKQLSGAQMQAVAGYVRDLGGGLILAGGENIYGQGGYTKTPVEDALPVTFDVSRKKPPTVAMIVVMDNSGSMNGLKMELAKTAAKAPLELLRDTDRFGVMAFNTTFTWVSQLANVTNRQAVINAISSVGVAGGTDGYPAMEEAFQALNRVSDEIKTILFLTDGRTQLRDYKTLTTKMTANGIHVTTVAIGQGADRELLADISMWGKGRAYYVEAANNVPQIFIRETELAMDKALHEAPFNLLVKKSVDAFKGIDFQAAPLLLGYVSTKPKPTSEILLTESLAGEPVLARWQYGLGKTAMFASDLKDRWAVNWLQWGGYKKFWSQLVRETMRRNPTDFDFRVNRSGDSAVVTINAVGKDGRFRNALDLKTRLVDPNRNTLMLDVPQIGPGAYETRVRLARNGEYEFGSGIEKDPGPSRALTYSYPDEYRFYPTNAATLEEVSRETGGKFEPAASDIVDKHGESIEVPYALWPWLAGLGLILFVTDVLLRRLRLFEPV
jgi:uncharacterized membrane protein